MAGLLHNIGIVLLINFYAADYIKLLKKSQEDNKHYLYQLEQEEYGFTHTEVSEYLSKWWNAPDQITETSAFHVAPLSYAIVNRDLVCKIHIAQHYAGKILGLNPFCEFNPETFDVLGIDRMDFENTYRDFL
jgi:HD-like signal output (HDOD) protein